MLHTGPRMYTGLGLNQSCSLFAGSSLPLAAQQNSFTDQELTKWRSQPPRRRGEMLHSGGRRDALTPVGAEKVLLRGTGDLGDECSTF